MSAQQWDADRVSRWLGAVDRLEGQLAPVADLLLDAVALAPGERVVDVGCGHGPTTRRAAALVGPTGEVVGLDVSEAMLEAAAAVPVQDGTAPIEWVAADATTWRAEPVDVVMSRFGVMFFDDPAAAFTNLASMTRPGGRFCVVVWAHRELCPLFEVPLAGALGALDALGVSGQPVPAPDEGAFSLSDRDAVVDLLTAAGWTDVEWTPHRLTLPFGGGGSAVEVAPSALDVGAVRVVTTGLAEDVLTAVTAAVADALEPYEVDGEVRLDAVVGIVTARRAAV